jgi:hypothetical protein
VCDWCLQNKYSVLLSSNLGLCEISNLAYRGPCPVAAGSCRDPACCSDGTGSTPRYDCPVGRARQVGHHGARSGPIRPSESSQARCPADLLVRAAGLGESFWPGRHTCRCLGRARQDRILTVQSRLAARLWLDHGPPCAGQPGRSCIAARLAMTVQSDEWGLSGTVGPGAQLGHPSRVRLCGRQTSSSGRWGLRAWLALPAGETHLQPAGCSCLCLARQDSTV